MNQRNAFMCSYVSIMATFSYEYIKVLNFSLCLLSFFVFFFLMFLLNFNRNKKKRAIEKERGHVSKS